MAIQSSFESDTVEHVGIKVGDHEWIVWVVLKTKIIPVIVNLLNGRVSVAPPEHDD